MLVVSAADADFDTEADVDPPAPGPFAAGVHLPWADVPVPVHEWAATVGGGVPSRAQDLAGGFSPGAIARLGFESGPDIFVKAVGTELNPDSPGMHRREGVISAALPVSPLLPRLLAAFDDGQWVALAFAVVDGRLPRHPWRDTELDLVLRAHHDIHELLTPSPAPEIASAGEHLRAAFGGWQRLAGGDGPVDRLDEWSRHHLDRLAELESSWPRPAAARPSYTATSGPTTCSSPAPPPAPPPPPPLPSSWTGRTPPWERRCSI
jgi:hypothetical protein